jgi:hypothetical protein
VPRTATAAAVATAIDDEGRGAFAPAAAPTAAPAAAAEPCELELYRAECEAAAEPCELELYRAERDGASCHCARVALEHKHSIEFILNPEDSHCESDCKV